MMLFLAKCLITIVYAIVAVMGVLICLDDSDSKKAKVLGIIASILWPFVIIWVALMFVWEYLINPKPKN